MKSITCAYLLFALALLNFGCAKSIEEVSAPAPPPSAGDKFTDYIISKGHHYSNGTFAQISGKQLSFEAIFDSSCIYNSKSAENAGDINKLYGFSDCNTHHQENSARVGWTWNNNTIELFAYCYANGERSSESIGTAMIGDTLQVSISVSPTAYVFYYKGASTQMKRHCGTPDIEGYLLHPYFGGDETAPHDMRIRIRHVPEVD